MSSTCEYSIESEINSVNNDQINQTDSNDDIILELIEMLKPYSSAYTEELGQLQLAKASAYQLAISMAVDILLKLYDIKEKNSMFAKIVIQKLWCIKNENKEINIIEMIYKFLTICGSYPNAEFKNCTFGSRTHRVKKEKFDPKYDITFSQCEKKLEETKFIEMFKAFRSIIGRFFRNCTGSYKIPTFESIKDWSYSVRISDDQYEKKQTQEFVNFMIDMIEIFVELEKLTPELSEIYSIFTEASQQMNEQREKKMEMKKIKDNKFIQNKNKFKKEINNTQNNHIIPQKIQKDVKILSPPISRWGTINPITGKNIVIQQDIQNEEIITDIKLDDDFIVINKKQHNDKPYMSRSERRNGTKNFKVLNIED